jgi:hypothetical protein
MLTVAEERWPSWPEHGKEVSIHLFGQEVNPETYAISKADLLLKGEGAGGREHEVRLHALQRRLPVAEFDFMLSNPPYGKSWKTDLERMGGKGDMQGPALRHPARGDPEYSLITRSSDGQLMFLVNKLSKMKHNTPLGQPHRRGPQRLVALHRRRRPGREQHPPLDHRERLAGGHHRPAAEHVLQHRHRHLHLGADQPQAGAPPGQGPAHRRHRDGSSRCARTWARRTASTPDAWIDENKTQIGYEVSFTFYKPTPMRTLEEIRADLQALQKEAEGLLDSIVGTGEVNYGKSRPDTKSGKAGARGDQAQFRKTVEALAADERAKNHKILADRLIAQLQQDGNGRPKALSHHSQLRTLSGSH